MDTVGDYLRELSLSSQNMRINTLKKSVTTFVDKDNLHLKSIAEKGGNSYYFSSHNKCRDIKRLIDEMPQYEGVKLGFEERSNGYCSLFIEW